MSSKQALAPESRVYKSVTPMPQRRFPDRKQRVRSYGKRNNTTKRTATQETLTQMDWMKLVALEAADEEEEEKKAAAAELDKENQDMEFVKKEEKLEKKPRAARRRTTGGKVDDSGAYEIEEKKRSSKRRRTMGDEPPSTASNHHTQTLTQIPDWTLSFSGDNEDADETPRPTKLAKGTHHHISESPIKKKPYLETKRVLRSRSHTQSPVKQDALATRTSPRILKKSTTPLKERSTNIRVLPKPREISKPKAESKPKPVGKPLPQTPIKSSIFEIPSSESPMSPFLYSPGQLQQKSTVDSTPLSDISSSLVSLRAVATAKPQDPDLPIIEVKDSYETEGSLCESLAPSTQAKRSSPTKSVRFALPKDSPEEQNTRVTRKTEILDSDAESDEDEVMQTLEEEYDEICPDDIGIETQIEVEKLLSSSSSSLSDVAIESMETTDESYAQDTSPQDTSTQKVAGFATQVESQRLSTQNFASMAPRTMVSDIFLSIHPEWVAKIVDRSKDHEFRTWLIPSTVSRIWIYVTVPQRTLKYMAVIGPAKLPGDIVDCQGAGNAEFNATPPGQPKYAYEILELYELAEPLPLATMLAKQWLKCAPQKFAWVRPAVLGELMANLKPPMFGQGEMEVEDDGEEEQENQVVEEKESQEVIDEQESQVVVPEERDNQPVFKQEQHDQEAVLYGDKGHEESAMEEEPDEVTEEIKAELIEDYTHYSSSTDSQDIEDQMLNSMRQYTQIEEPFNLSPRSANATVSESSEHENPARVQREKEQSQEQTVLSTPRRPLIRPSQASTVDETQMEARTPTPLQDCEIIWESPTRRVARTPSSPSSSRFVAAATSIALPPLSSELDLDLPTPRPRGTGRYRTNQTNTHQEIPSSSSIGINSDAPSLESSHSLPNLTFQPPHHLSVIPSSQLLTRSQMLPESLMVDSMSTHLSLEVRDSEDEDDI